MVEVSKSSNFYTNRTESEFTFACRESFIQEKFSNQSTYILIEQLVLKTSRMFVTISVIENTVYLSGDRTSNKF